MKKNKLYHKKMLLIDNPTNQQILYLCKRPHIMKPISYLKVIQ